MERGLEDEVRGADAVEQFRLAARVVHTDELLIERNGQGGRAAEACHLVPLSGAYGLLDGVQREGGETLQLLRGVGRREGSVGIHAQLDFVGGEVASDEVEQRQFALEVDGAYLQLDAAEARPHLLLDACIHLVERAHPDESVGDDALLSAGKGAVPQTPFPSGTEVAQGGLQSEADGGIVAQEVVGQLSVGFRQPAGASQGLLIVRDVVAAQSRERCTLAPATVRLSVRRAQQAEQFRLAGACVPVRTGGTDVPHLPRGEHTARGPCRLLEVEPVGKDIQLQVRHRVRGVWDTCSSPVCVSPGRLCHPPVPRRSCSRAWWHPRRAPVCPPVRPVRH